jgi:hypothetical protein
MKKEKAYKKKKIEEEQERKAIKVRTHCCAQALIRHHAVRPCQRRCSCSTAKWHNNSSTVNCDLS